MLNAVCLISSLLIIGHFVNGTKDQLFHGNIKYINLYIPINPHVQLMYENGLNGGYGNSYKRYHRGKTVNLKFPFNFYKKSDKGNVFFLLLQ